MQRIHVHVTDKQASSLEVLAKQEGIPRSECLRKIIDLGLEAVFKKSRIPMGRAGRGVSAIIPKK